MSQPDVESDAIPFGGYPPLSAKADWLTLEQMHANLTNVQRQDTATAVVRQ